MGNEAIWMVEGWGKKFGLSIQLLSGLVLKVPFHQLDQE